MRKPHGYYRKLCGSPALLRIAIGLLLIVGGILGFLPILGFWMAPLGLVVIFIDVPWIKRTSSRLRKWSRRDLRRKTDQS